MNESSPNKLLTQRSKYFVSGVFYPTNHIVVALHDGDSSARLREACRAAGFDEDFLFALSHAEIVERHSKRQDGGIVQGFANFFSGWLGQESIYHAEYVELAKSGHPLMMIYAPQADDTKRAADSAKLHHPIHMRKYVTSGVIELI